LNKIKFCAAERSLGLISDNLINYNAGPLYFEVLHSERTILITNMSCWDFCIPDALPVIKGVWEIPDENITFIDKNQVIIKYDVNIISNYLFYNIFILAD